MNRVSSVAACCLYIAVILSHFSATATRAAPRAESSRLRDEKMGPRLLTKAYMSMVLQILGVGTAREGFIGWMRARRRSHANTHFKHMHTHISSGHFKHMHTYFERTRTF